MNLYDVVDTMSMEMYERLKHAAETGKWPEGTPVDQAQRDSAMQLSMAYQARHLNSDDILTIGSDGEIVNKSKAELKRQFKQFARENNNPQHEDIARFTDL
ncbi:YeaC family protein [Thalassotalea sp. ND16A]|uniref:YeaC family protein n=1 Tax=Thalassotalea sp. ND16A TaxID=1535422 RepID=UPI00051A88D1|nr:DUF1315 family protein [Thalassotalea sp. ND16A]KGJ98355.1 hypothetical protein ND16A_0664 [Thalassotalea sp. ND16A]